jgi:predicted translation initiation factor SUI1
MKPKQTFRGAVIKPGTKAPAAGESFGTSLGALLGASLGKPAPNPASGPSADDVKNARVRVGREVAGRGGKGVSVITGLPLNAAGLEELATKLKKSCGAGGVAKDGRIEIQGDHRDRLLAELIKLGYNAKRSGG